MKTLHLDSNKLDELFKIEDLMGKLQLSSKTQKRESKLFPSSLNESESDLDLYLLEKLFPVLLTGMEDLLMEVELIQAKSTFPFHFGMEIQLDFGLWGGKRGQPM